MPRNDFEAGGPPTKTVTAPDGSQIHFPNLPNVGERFQPHHVQESEQRNASASLSHATSPTPVSRTLSLGERFSGAAQWTIERTGALAQAAFKSLVGDDWKGLISPNSTPLERLEGGVGLASWLVPEGKITEIAVHALAKAAEHLSASGFEHTAEHLTAAGAFAARWAERSRNEKIAEQPPWNNSDIWNRPLTDAERRGSFRTADDAKAFLGPATERGGADRDWHHIVESNTEKRFGPERIHNIRNLGAIERDTAHKEISNAYRLTDPLLGPDSNGAGQSLRTFLKDKTFDDHVDAGEDALLKHGIDPATLRSQTMQRFEQRLQLHDRLIREPQAHEASGFTLPTALSVSAGSGLPSSADVQRAVNQIRSEGKMLPDVQNIRSWNGKSAHGSFVDLGNGMVAQHTGRGDYAVMDVERDLGGVKPPIGQYVVVNATGGLQLQQAQSLAPRR